jgi:nucleotide-binding universal stress UspA family protein
MAEAGRRLDLVVRGLTDIHVDRRVLLGDPAEEIAAAAADLRAGLTVLFLRRGHGLFGARPGSITYRVLCGTSTPVLAFPPSRSGRA